MTTDELVRQVRGMLVPACGAGEAQWMTRMIVGDVLHYTPVDVALRGDLEQPEALTARALALARRVAGGEPIQYVLGHARFHGHELKVTPDVLIPRPETERLVDIIVDENRHREDLRVLDVGTGSGCIAVSLARALPFAQVTGTDVSAAALAVARENARTLRVHVNFKQADILDSTPLPCPLDLVVSNPPYVCRSESAGMERNVLDHEPALALWVPDADPLRFYRAITKKATRALSPGGLIYFEINSRFGEQMRQLLEGAGFADVRIMNDLFGRVRYAAGAWPQ